MPPALRGFCSPAAVVLALCALAWLSVPSSRARAQAHDPSSVVASSVRDAARLSAEKQLGSLDLLTHYDFELELIPLTKRFKLTERVQFSQREPAALPELVL